VGGGRGEGEKGGGKGEGERGEGVGGKGGGGGGRKGEGGGGKWGVSSAMSIISMQPICIEGLYLCHITDTFSSLPWHF
jgi:hypothetical protein